MRIHNIDIKLDSLSSANLDFNGVSIDGQLRFLIAEILSGMSELRREQECEVS